VILYLLSDKTLRDKYEKKGKIRVSCFNAKRILKEYEKLI